MAQNSSDIRNSPEFALALLTAQAGEYLAELGQVKMQLLVTQERLAVAEKKLQEPQ